MMPCRRFIPGTLIMCILAGCAGSKSFFHEIGYDWNRLRAIIPGAGAADRGDEPPLATVVLQTGETRSALEQTGPFVFFGPASTCWA